MQPDTTQWEALCLRCGRCCYEKLEYRGRVYYTGTPCERLDTGTALCTVYERRQLLRPGCVRLTPKLVRAGILPADCPYVRNIPGYLPPILPDDE